MLLPFYLYWWAMVGLFVLKGISEMIEGMRRMPVTQSSILAPSRMVSEEVVGLRFQIKTQ